MVDLSGLASFAGAAYPGFVQGQNNQAALAANQEAAKQAQLRSQALLESNLSDEATGRTAAMLATLGQAYGVAPPSTPAPQAPGQPSAPDQSAGPPPVPNTAAPPPAPAPAPAAAPPPPNPLAPPPADAPAQAQPAPPARPAPIPNAPAGGPPPTGQVPPPAKSVGQRALNDPAVKQALAPLAGQLSMQQLSAAIIKANPGIEKQPRLLYQAIQKSQALLAPDSKAELAAMALQQKIDAATQQLELGKFKVESTADIATMKAELAKQIQDVREKGLDDRQARLLQEKSDDLIRKLQSQLDLLTQKDKDAGDRGDKKNKTEIDKAEIAAASREKVAKTVADARQNPQGVVQQQKVYATQVANLNRDITQLLAGGPEPKSGPAKDKLDGLKKQRDAVGQQMQDLADKTKAAGVRLPSRAEAIADAAKELDKKPAEDAGASDTPPVELLKEGTVTTFDDNSKWTLKDGKPEKVP